MSSVEPAFVATRLRGRYRHVAVLAALVGASVLGVGSSVPVSAATPAPSVAYGFNEGAGTTVADSSGNARNGLSRRRRERSGRCLTCFGPRRSCVG